MYRVGVDLMGSDQPPHAIFEAIMRVRGDLNPSSRLVVIATHEVYPELRQRLSEASDSPVSIEFITTEETIEMGDSPLLAVRRKKKSSMAAGMRLLKEGEIDAFISTGNTGALIATAMLHLSMLPGVERPGLLVMFPAGNGGVAVLDVGANITPKPEHLFDYAKMGVVYREAIHGIENPTVGLLNIGVEEEKGTKEVKETYRMLQEAFKERFLGNIEGREVFEGKIDVLVTDGFTGNVFLKTCEGVSSFLSEYLQDEFASKGNDLMKEKVAGLYARFNYSEHPGAMLCGVDGVVVKCHGYSNEAALMNGVRGAFRLAEERVIERMREVMS